MLFMFAKISSLSAIKPTTNDNNIDAIGKSSIKDLALVKILVKNFVVYHHSAYFDCKYRFHFPYHIILYIIFSYPIKSKNDI